MPLNEKIFDAQIRFVIKSDLKARLFREAKRRHMAAADLLRLFIEEGLVKNDGRLGGSVNKLTKEPRIYKMGPRKAKSQRSGPHQGNASISRRLPPERGETRL